MVLVETLTFDEQVEALRERGILDHEARSLTILEAARLSSRSSVGAHAVPGRRPRRGGGRSGRTPWTAGRPWAPDTRRPRGFVPIDAVELPGAPAYLAIDVDLGAGSRNVRPEDALRSILEAPRSPLTLDEGVALVLQQPEVVAHNWGFSMAGSRRGDQRVPAFWISEGSPKLGWCWDRNPHTWLGTASCARRLAGQS